MKLRSETSITDQAVQSATGRSWGEWYDLLDQLGSAEAGHLRMARHLRYGHGLPSWWAQAVFIRYYHDRG
jgi:hypothetical protein